MHGKSSGRRLPHFAALNPTEMENKIRNLKRVIIFLLIIPFFLSSCSRFSGGIRETSVPLEGFDMQTGDLYEIQEIILTLKNKNENLEILKGLGKIRIWNKNGHQTARTAWIGSKSGRFRIEILSVSGQPVASLANDGEHFFILSHSDRKFYKKRVSESNLEKFLAIPVKSEDVFAFLSGRVPVKDHDSAFMAKNTDGDGYVLILKKKWRGLIENIYLDKSKKIVQAVEMLDINGSLVYRAEIISIHNEAQYQLPSRIVLFNDNGEGFQLDIEKYWTNIPVSPSLFMLLPPE